MNALEILNSFENTEQMLNKTKILLEKARRCEDDGVKEIDYVFLNDVYDHMIGYKKLLLHILEITEV